MNIGIDIRPLLNPYKTGVGEYTEELTFHLLEAAPEHRFFLYYNTARATNIFDRFSHYANAHSIATRLPNKLFNLSVAWCDRPRINRYIRTGNTPTIDAFISPNLNFTTLDNDVVHGLTVHDLSFEFFPEFYSRKQRLWHRAIQPRRLVEQAHIITTPSEHTRQDFIEYYGVPPEKIHVIAPGIGRSFADQINNLSTHALNTVRARYHLPEKFIVYLGTVETRKDVVGLVHAFNQYLETTDDRETHLVIAGALGAGYETVVRAKHTSVHAARIHLAGYVDAVHKAALYRCATAMVYPSRYEGFGLPILEACAAGTPVITTARSSLPEAGADAAYYCQPAHPLALAQAIEHVISSEKIRSTMIKKGIAHAAKFSYRDTARQWLALLDRYVGG